MISNDSQQYLTVDIFNSRMDTFLSQIRLENEKLRGELKAEIQAVRADLHAKILDVRAEGRVNSAKIDMLQHTFYWGFGIMTLVITFVAFLVPYFRREHKQKATEQHQQGISREDVINIVKDVLRNPSIIGKWGIKKSPVSAHLQSCRIIRGPHYKAYSQQL